MQTEDIREVTPIMEKLKQVLQSETARQDRLNC